MSEFNSQPGANQTQEETQGQTYSQPNQVNYQQPMNQAYYQQPYTPNYSDPQGQNYQSYSNPQAQGYQTYSNPQGSYYAPYAAGVPDQAQQRGPVSFNEAQVKGMRRTSFWGGLLTGVVAVMLVVGVYFMIQSFSRANSSASIAYDQLGPDATLSPEEQQQVLAKMDTLIRYISAYYVEEVDVDDLLDGAYHGMVDALDDKYASYMNAEEYADYNMDSSGDYVGIGVTVQISQGDVKGLEVINVSQEGAAYEAGIQVGDIIIGADDFFFEDEMLLNEMVSHVRGVEGSIVDITYVRGGQTYTVSMERRKLHETNVYYTVMDGNVGYLALTGFTANAQSQFDAALKDLQSQGITSLVLDLRDNGGGLVSVCVDIADHIIGKGTVTYLEMRDGYQEKYSATSDDELNIPIVVLVNGNSASASELLTLCLMDYGKVTVVGTQTYGKGIAQSTYGLKDGTAIKFTVAKYYSPEGTNIHGEGITPDVIVELPEDVTFASIKTNGIPDVTKDTQLQEALRILKEGR